MFCQPELTAVASKSVGGGVGVGRGLDGLRLGMNEPNCIAIIPFYFSLPCTFSKLFHRRWNSKQSVQGMRSMKLVGTDSDVLSEVYRTFLQSHSSQDLGRAGRNVTSVLHDVIFPFYAA